MVESLILGVVGMALVFLGLGIVIVSIYVLEWAFRERGQESEALPVGANSVGDVEDAAPPHPAVVAAIALALARETRSLSTEARANLGKNLEREPDAWTLSARSRQLQTWGGR
jgi:Na+-transporting methylmalonyl-CoA/oxaloacetate decarboxylase gamma subunit